MIHQKKQNARMHTHTDCADEMSKTTLHYKVIPTDMKLFTSECILCRSTIILISYRKCKKKLLTCMSTMTAM